MSLFKKVKKVGLFEKVSEFQFTESLDKRYSAEKAMSYIELPHRSTKGSAGYDIVSPIGFTLKPGESVTFPTGLKCRIKDGWMLAIFPRSGMGFKYKVRLANTVGIIDSDYYNNADNEGHIMVKLCNEGNKKLVVEAGDRVAQGIFIPYGITEDDFVTEERDGGFGSTGN